MEKRFDMSDKLTCPHCGGTQYCHEPDEISATMCLTECEHCGEHFWYSVVVTRTYRSYTEE